MKKLGFKCLITCWLLLICSITSAQDIAINSWRTHLPNNNAVSIADAGSIIYCGTQHAVFSLDKEDNSLEIFDKVKGLSDIGISAINYSANNSILFIAYSNSNIDLLKNNRVINISDIKRKNMVGDKDIYHISFINEDAYLSCGFGIVVLNLIREEIKDTYYIGPQGAFIRVNSTTTDGNKIYAATEIGVLEALLTNPFLNDPTSWHLHDTTENTPNGECDYIVNNNGKLYAIFNDSIFEYSSANWSYYYSKPDRNIYSISVSGNRIFVGEKDDTSGIELNSRITIIDSVKQISIIENGEYLKSIEKVIDDNTYVWIADRYYGLIKNKGSSFERISPNGPSSSGVFEIFSKNNEVWVAPGGVHFDWTSTYNKDGFFSFSKNWWSGYNNFNYPALDTILDFITIAIDSIDNHVYMGSFRKGLVEFYNNEIIQIYNDINSSLQRTIGDIQTIRVSGLAYDKHNNLWVSNFGAAEPISVKQANGNWKSFAPPASLDIGQNYLGQIVVDNYDQKWIVAPKGKGILVFNHGQDIEDISDDQYMLMKSGEENGNLPDVNVLCIAKDLDGEIWVGTTQGIAVFYCTADVFSTNKCDADKILVKQDNYLGYLMETEFVNTIAIDGANRKWIGTNNGVWLMSEDGLEEILNFNVDNSPLLSNNIIDIEVNHETGEVFIGTDQGIISYKGTATKGGAAHGNVVVYPNPVRENYKGVIAIKGLVNDAYVKITDISGKLIYDTKALGGQAIWNGNNFNGERAHSGIYLVFSTDFDGKETFVAKFLIIN